MLSILLTSQVLPEEITPAWDVVGIVVIRFSFLYSRYTMMPNGSRESSRINAVESRFKYTSLYSILSYPILLYTSKVKMNGVI